MRKSTQHLNDEHMQLYEWSGVTSGIAGSIPTKSKRSHPWHASYSVLTVLTSLLILNGCDNKGPVEQAGQRVGQPAQDMKEEAGKPYDDAAAAPAPAQEAGRSPGEAREQVAEEPQKP